jgi:hypothetical protein
MVLAKRLPNAKLQSKTFYFFWAFVSTKGAYVRENINCENCGDNFQLLIEGPLLWAEFDSRFMHGGFVRNIPRSPGTMWARNPDCGFQLISAI